MELFSIRIQRTFQLVSTIYDKNHNIIGNYNNGFVTFKEK